jgi:hypothetical protein
VARSVRAALVGVVLGVGTGWAAVQLGLSGRRPSESRAATPVGAVAPVEVPERSPVDCGALDAELASLQTELALSQRLLADLQAELEGVPAVWSDAVTPEHQPDAFRALMAEVAVRCPDVKVLKVDCSEPPCHAWLAHDIDARSVAAEFASDRLVNCPTWVEAYGDRVDESSFRVCAPDTWGSVVSVRTGKVAQAPDDIANLYTRRLTRVDRAREGWPCTAP